jgi:hypothetical protein
MNADRNYIAELMERSFVEPLNDLEQHTLDASLAENEMIRHEYGVLKALHDRLHDVTATFYTPDEVQPSTDLQNRIFDRVKSKAIPACLDHIHHGLSNQAPRSVWMDGPLPDPIDLPECGYRLIFDRRSMDMLTRGGTATIGFVVIRAEPQDGVKQLVKPDDLMAHYAGEDGLSIVFQKMDGYYSIRTEPARVSEMGLEWQLKESDIMYGPRDTFRLSLSSHRHADDSADTETFARVAGVTPDAIEHLTQIVPVNDEAVDEGFVCYCLMFEHTSEEEFEIYSNEIMKQYRPSESQKVAGLRGLYLTLQQDSASALQTTWKRKRILTEDRP